MSASLSQAHQTCNHLPAPATWGASCLGTSSGLIPFWKAISSKWVSQVFQALPASKVWKLGVLLSLIACQTWHSWGRLQCLPHSHCLTPDKIPKLEPELDFSLTGVLLCNLLGLWLLKLWPEPLLSPNSVRTPLNQLLVPLHNMPFGCQASRNIAHYHALYGLYYFSHNLYNRFHVLDLHSSHVNLILQSYCVDLIGHSIRGLHVPPVNCSHPCTPCPTWKAESGWPSTPCEQPSCTMDPVILKGASVACHNIGNIN